MTKLAKPIHAKPSLYAMYFMIIKEIGLKYGYNILLNGSMNRDIDLVAVPWVEVTGDKEAMIDEIAEVIGGRVLNELTVMPHGRIIYIININRFFELDYTGTKAIQKVWADPQYYIDISVYTNQS